MSKDKIPDLKLNMSTKYDEWIEGYVFEDLSIVKSKIREIVKYTLEQAAEKGLVRCYSTEGKDEQSQPFFYFVDADETVKVDEQSILSLEDSIIKDLKL